MSEMRLLVGIQKGVFVLTGQVIGDWGRVKHGVWDSANVVGLNT